MNALGFTVSACVANNIINKKKKKRSNINYVEDNDGNVDGNNSNNSNADDEDISRTQDFIGFCIFCVMVVASFYGLKVLFKDEIDKNTPGTLDNPMLEFQVNSLEVNNMKVYNSSNDYYSIVRNQEHITADLDFDLTVKNKDAQFMYFDSPQASLECDHEAFLSSTKLEPFHLLGNPHLLQFGMQIKDDARVQNETVDSISQDLWSQNVVQFALKVQGDFVRWHRNVFEKCSVNVSCDDLKVRFLSASNFTTGSMIANPILCNSKYGCHRF